MGDPPASGRYELGEVIQLPLSRWQKFVGFLDASQGHRPFSLFGVSEVQVIDRSTGAVAFAAAFRYEAPMTAMLEQIRRDLSQLTVAAFEEQYGIRSEGRLAGSPASQPTATYYDSSPRVAASGMAQAIVSLGVWTRSLVTRRRPGPGSDGSA